MWPIKVWSRFMISWKYERRKLVSIFKVTKKPKSNFKWKRKIWKKAIFSPSSSKCNVNLCQGNSNAKNIEPEKSLIWKEMVWCLIYSVRAFFQVIETSHIWSQCMSHKINFDHNKRQVLLFRMLLKKVWAEEKKSLIVKSFFFRRKFHCSEKSFPLVIYFLWDCLMDSKDQKVQGYFISFVVFGEKTFFTPSLHRFERWNDFPSFFCPFSDCSNEI